MYEATERAMDWRFPANGVYIVKPTISTPDKRYQFIWGDSVHLSANGARRMGKSPHGLIVSQPPGLTHWPTDVTAYS